MSTFGSRFKRLRQQHNLTQDAAAKIFHVDKSSISKWENNKNGADNEVIQQIANYFNVSIDYLLCRDENPNTTSSPEMLTKKEKLDIEKEALQMIENIDKAKIVEFCGNPADDEDKEFLRLAYEKFLSDVRVYNKMKYTPRKYKK